MSSPSADAVTIGAVQLSAPVAAAALEVANRAHPVELTGRGMSPRGAQALCAARPFRSLSEVAAARGVGPATLRQLRAIAERANALWFEHGALVRLWSLAADAAEQAQVVQSVDPVLAERRATVARTLRALHQAWSQGDDAALRAIHEVAWPSASAPRPAWVDRPDSYVDPDQRFVAFVAATLRAADGQIQAAAPSPAVRDAVLRAVAHALLFALPPERLRLSEEQCVERLDRDLPRALDQWPTQPQSLARRALRAVGLDRPRAAERRGAARRKR